MKKNIVLVTVAIFCAGLLTSCSRQEPTAVDTTPPPATIVGVKINEIYSRGTVANPDWIEIYNPNASAVDLSGYTVYALAGKNGTSPKRALPAGTTIAAKSVVVVVVNDTTVTGKFDLSAAGETVWLENAAAAAVDSATFPALGIDSSYARKPDGSATWVTVTPPTKGVANAVLPIVLNEIFSRGIAGELDWIEVYNPNSVSVDISGYKVYDAGGQTGAKAKKEFPAGTTIPANGFAVIVTDTASFTGDLSGFGISSSGEPLWLENASGNIIDNIAMVAITAATSSYGRIPDGGTTWQILTTRTRGAVNIP